ncbi:MAG: flagellar basal body L-ring protein [Candidatus Cloacimonadota bacterium]|nr:MAG: flagellar basal body L-ring protein [Candidatus Cloacimonadota bacterium]
MKRLFFVLIVAFFGIVYAQPSSSLYSDHKSFDTGDVITILILEYTTAEASAGSQTDKTFNHGFGSSAGQGPLDFIPLSSFGINSKNAQKGKASTSREATLKGKITAKITDIDANGNLFIKGKRSVIINGEEETTSVEGYVRPQDVRSDNSVYSHNIADAKITYKGKGAVRDGAKVGFITRFFNFLF